MLRRSFGAGAGGGLLEPSSEHGGLFVVRAECLCEAFKNSAQLGVTLNVSKALSLPTACHVSAPSVTNCGLSIGTGDAPALSPLAVSPSSVAGTPSAAIGADEVSPSPAPALGSSGSSSLATSIELLVLTRWLLYFYFILLR
ncbi:hypothetical protein DH2020_045232 [Rehmannia glutinosa]|uniref:Bifunctional inhibitor/plant lipid transfer protein/seed storage helical domain-containing protein n=1 Tax=Rehmannia glutinosa TaxID=99300 RepID=A0ABR0UEP3_REHGL